MNGAHFTNLKKNSLAECVERNPTFILSSLNNTHLGLDKQGLNIFEFNFNIQIFKKLGNVHDNAENDNNFIKLFVKIKFAKKWNFKRKF